MQKAFSKGETKMKKLFTMLLAAVIALSLAACSSSSSESENAPANRLEEIKQRGYITVATEPYFAPNEFIDPTSSLQSISQISSE